MNFKSLSLTNVLFGCLSVGCILLLLFSDRGFIALWNLKKEKIEIQEDINSLRVGFDINPSSINTLGIEAPINT